MQKSYKTVFSAEQKEILNIKLEKYSIITIKALAGTGKTTTVLELSLLNQQFTFLYVARNNSIVEDVKKTITKQKLKNIKASTMHAAAFHWIVSQRRNIKIDKLDAEKVGLILGIEKKNIKRHKDLQKISNLFSEYCSQLKTFEDWSNEILDDLITNFGVKHSNKIIENVKKVWDSIDNGTAEFITHSYYLKKFIDASPAIKEDCLIIDESQDLDDIMYAFVLKQIEYGKSVIAVGDQNQSIYGFLKSKDIIKSLNKNQNVIQKTLTRSFRFEPNSKMEILANAFLSLKNEKIYGAAVYEDDKIETTGYIARTNIQILQKMIELIKNNSDFYLVGGIEGFNLSLLFDIWHLSSRQSKSKVKSEFLKGFENKRELMEWAEEHKDVEIITACNIVDVLKKESQDSELKEAIGITEDNRKHFLSTIFKVIELKNNKRSKTILSTFHKSKGLSIDKVVILSSEKQIQENVIPVGFKSDKMFYEYNNIKYEKVSFDYDCDVYDEYNLMYVAVTRAKKSMSVMDKKIIVSANFSILLKNINNIKDNVNFYDNICFIKLPYQGNMHSFIAIDDSELAEFKQRVLEREV